MTPSVLLAFDSCADSCSVALLGPDMKEPVMQAKSMRRGHAEALLPMVAAVIEEAGAVMADIEAIAVTTGPGSFAGVRVGIAAARGLSLSLGVPAAGFSVLEALAFSAQRKEGARPCLVAIAARGSQYYAQAFDEAGVAQTEPQVMEQDALLTRFEAWPGLLTGRGAKILASRLSAACMVDPLQEIAPVLALMARQADPARWQSSPVPLYLRPPDATVSARRGLRRLDEA